MDYPQINFQVRINERSSLVQLGYRIEKVLQIKFHPSYSSSFEGDEVLEAESLGLMITLMCNSNELEGELRNYVLFGLLKGDYDALWSSDFPIMNISDYILGLLQKKDNDQWYVPSLDELDN